MDQDRPHYDALDDEALAVFFVADEDSPARAAFEILFRRHERMLRRRAEHYAGNDHAIAADAFALTMTEAWIRRADYKPESSSWVAWVTNRLSSRVIDELRDRVKYQQEQEGRELTAFSDKGALPPDRIVMDRDELDRALTALAAANPQAREVILLRYVDEFTVDEIAGRLSISMAVVYALIRTASEFLEGALGYQGDSQT